MTTLVTQELFDNEITQRVRFYKNQQVAGIRLHIYREGFVKETDAQLLMSLDSVPISEFETANLVFTQTLDLSDLTEIGDYWHGYVGFIPENAIFIPKNSEYIDIDIKFSFVEPKYFNDVNYELGVGYNIPLSLGTISTLAVLSQSGAAPIINVSGSPYTSITAAYNAVVALNPIFANIFKLINGELYMPPGNALVVPVQDVATTNRNFYKLDQLTFTFTEGDYTLESGKYVQLEGSTVVDKITQLFQYSDSYFFETDGNDYFLATEFTVLRPVTVSLVRNHEKYLNRVSNKYPLTFGEEISSAEQYPVDLEIYVLRS